LMRGCLGGKAKTKKGGPQRGKKIFDDGGQEERSHLSPHLPNEAGKGGFSGSRRGGTKGGETVRDALLRIVL